MLSILYVVHPCDAYFPVLWFLGSVPCVMYILRARLFFPLRLSLYALYFDMLRVSVCSYASYTPASLHTSCAMVPAICLRPVSCVMGILRADPFYPLCVPLRAIYSDVMCALVCPCELFVPVLCVCLVV